VLIENRNGLVVDTELVLCNGTAERDAALEMAGRIAGDQRVTVGADKGYDTRGFVQEMRDRNVTPHVSQNANRSGGSAIDGRTIRHAGYQVSQRKRKRIEEVFGWLKTVGMLRKTRHRGLRRVGWVFTFAASAYNLVRVRNLASALSSAAFSLKPLACRNCPTSPPTSAHSSHASSINASSECGWPALSCCALHNRRLQASRAESCTN